MAEAWQRPICGVQYCATPCTQHVDFMQGMAMSKVAAGSTCCEARWGQASSRVQHVFQGPHSYTMPRGSISVGGLSVPGQRALNQVVKLVFISSAIVKLSHIAHSSGTRAQAAHCTAAARMRRRQPHERLMLQMSDGVRRHKGEARTAIDDVGELSAVQVLDIGVGFLLVPPLLRHHRR